MRGPVVAALITAVIATVVAAVIAAEGRPVVTTVIATERRAVVATLITAFVTPERRTVVAVTPEAATPLVVAARSAGAVVTAVAVIATEAAAVTVVVTAEATTAVVPTTPVVATRSTLLIAARAGAPEIASVTAVATPRLRPVVGGVGGHRRDSCLEVLRSFSRTSSGYALWQEKQKGPLVPA
ncbi:hypothetical protein LRS74_26770 [Streptomyces sp. LX-29]|uniref:hypothetical protein n=1 Tax=Streptomyces sp. LX-29 TaxID=2900152 RepID=UPI00240D4F5B|nr:hypothetical protein [Streptomyces sp. LX-29]WFB10247.1 hypothetical protein LRS74_26770 [Streptomyces sp. LX-29]